MRISMKVIYDKRCTGRFKLIDTLLMKGDSHLFDEDYLYMILQEIVDDNGNKDYITLKMIIGNNGYTKKCNVGSYSHSTIKWRYDEVIKQYKPILREKRLKQLLD